jgi:NADH:ubiquinone oxidoreductase subunit E
LAIRVRSWPGAKLRTMPATCASTSPVSRILPSAAPPPPRRHAADADPARGAGSLGLAVARDHHRHRRAALAGPAPRSRARPAFYSFFHTRPMGEYRVLWSDNITDRMLGNLDLMQAMCQKLWLEPGRVSEDGLVSVDTTSCTGMCDQGPAVLVNYRAIPRMTRERVELMVELIRARKPVSDWPAEWFVIEDNIRAPTCCSTTAWRPAKRSARRWSAGPTPCWRRSRPSQLRGRGGAGFRHRHQVGSLPQRARGTAHITCLQRRRGRARHLQGPRAADPAYADLVFEGMSIAGTSSAPAAGCSTCAANTATCSSRWSQPGGTPRSQSCWAPTSSARASTSTSRSTSAPAPTSAARNRP